MRTSLPLLCAAALAAISCSGDGSESPRPTSMEPASGPSNQPTRVVIHGEGFLVLPSEQQSGGGAAIDARHRAWLDDVELDAVTWIDASTLEAVVPAGLPPGKKRLQVENAFGKRGALEEAFTVERSGSQTPAALLVSLAVQGDPTTVAVGQALSLTLTVADTGQDGANVTSVVPSVSPTGAATCDLPSPAPPRTIAGLTSTTFTWTCTPVLAGDLTLGATVAGTAVTGGAALQVIAPGVTLSVQLPAALTATIAASRSTVNVGQAVTATLTLTNGGNTTANITSITRATSGTATATCTQPTPAPTPIAPGAPPRTFTWTCTASSAGTLIMTGTASGTEAVSGAAISVTPATPATVLVQTPAALTASLAALPTTVTTGQAVDVTLTVRNDGGASSVISSVVPTRSGSAAATCGAVSPVTPQTIAGGAPPSTFTWTCTPSTAGTLTLDVTVAASDANTGAASSPAVAPVNVTVLRLTSLTATIGATPTIVSVGQPVAVTFTVTNGGPATANITAVEPVPRGGTAAATTTCGAVTPAPAPIAAGASTTFSWTCSSTGPGTLSLSGTVSGTDAVSGQLISAIPATPASVTVQQLAVTLTATTSPPTDPPTITLPGSVLLTLVLGNSGLNGAHVATVAATKTGGNNISCTSPGPVPQDVASGATAVPITWTCTPNKPGPYTLGATVTATDLVTDQPVPVTVPTVTVIAN